MERALSPRLTSGRSAPSEEDRTLCHLEAFDIDLEDLSKIRLHLVTATKSPLVSARERTVLAIYWGCMVLVVDPPFVVYFLSIVGACVALAARTAIRMPHSVHATARTRSPWVSAGCCILVAGVVLRFLHEYEIDSISIDFALPALGTDSQPPEISFFRMHNPILVYTEDVEMIHEHMNGGLVLTQKLGVDPSMDVWASDVFRYEFLRHVWRSQAASSHIFCLAESDVVFDERYIASILSSAVDDPVQPLELAHAQHFWGRRVFEPYNIGLLCTSSKASQQTRLWAWTMSYLHRKRYRRLLSLEFLFALVPNRVVLHWDGDHGCTEFHPHCKYIHFTQPKSSTIMSAVQSIQQGWAI